MAKGRIVSRRMGLGPGLRKLFADRDKVVAMIQAAEDLAHRTGLHVTGHALNRAKNACGWELAGDVDKAFRAGFDKSVEDQERYAQGRRRK